MSIMTNADGAKYFLSLSPPGWTCFKRTDYVCKGRAAYEIRDEYDNTWLRVFWSNYDDQEHPWRFLLIDESGKRVHQNHQFEGKQCNAHFWVQIRGAIEEYFRKLGLPPKCVSEIDGPFYNHHVGDDIGHVAEDFETVTIYYMGKVYVRNGNQRRSMNLPISPKEDVLRRLWSCATDWWKRERAHDIHPDKPTSPLAGS